MRDIPCGTKGGVMINFEKIEVGLYYWEVRFPIFSMCVHWVGFLFQVVNRLRKEFVYETLLNYGVQYDNTWIYDKIHHEINQFCSSHSLQEVYIDVFDQVSNWLYPFSICSFSTPYAVCPIQSITFFLFSFVMWTWGSWHTLGKNYLLALAFDLMFSSWGQSCVLLLCLHKGAVD